MSGLNDYLPSGGFMIWNSLGYPVAVIDGKQLSHRDTWRLLNRKFRELNRDVVKEAEWKIVKEK